MSKKKTTYICNKCGGRIRTKKRAMTHLSLIPAFYRRVKHWKGSIMIKPGPLVVCDGVLRLKQCQE